MLILSRVCAEFHDRNGIVLFSVTPADRNTFVEAPEAIREDPLFRMLVEDGSMEVAVTDRRKKELESDPLADADAEGRSSAAARSVSRKPAPKPADPAPADK